MRVKWFGIYEITLMAKGLELFIDQNNPLYWPYIFQSVLKKFRFFGNHQQLGPSIFRHAIFILLFLEGHKDFRGPPRIR